MAIPLTDSTGTVAGTYTYAADNPLNGTDPLGLFGWSDWTSFINTAAMVTSAIALATAEIPGVDAVTAGVAGVVDLAAGVTNAVSFAQDLASPCASVAQTIADGLGAALSLVGAGGLIEGSLGLGLDLAAAEDAGGGLTRVGRWMSQNEFDQISNTGRVVEGAGGRTYVVNPPDPAAYPSAAKGSIYAEFDVPTSSLRSASKPEWGVIPGPNVTTRIYGPSPAEMPLATCIVWVCSK